MVTLSSSCSLNSFSQVSVPHLPIIKVNRRLHAGTLELPTPRQSTTLCCSLSSKSHCRTDEDTLDTYIQSDLFQISSCHRRNPYETSQSRIKCYKAFLQSAVFLTYIGLIPQIDGGETELPVFCSGAALHCCMQPGDFQLPSLVPFLSSISFGNGCSLILWTEITTSSVGYTLTTSAKFHSYS